VQPLPPAGTAVGGRGGGQTCGSLAACQLPAICLMLLGWSGAGAPQWAALWWGRVTDPPLSSFRPAPSQDLVLPLAPWASLGVGSGPGGWRSGGDGGSHSPRGPGFWTAEVGHTHLSRSTTGLAVVLPPRVVFLLFLT